MFEVNRRVVFYNGITGDYILTVEGLCSLGNLDAPTTTTKGIIMGVQSYQQQVVDFLRENPKSTGAEIAAGLAKYGKSQNSIDLLIKALRTKGLCKMTSKPGIEWRYELTELCKANGFCSVLPDKAVNALLPELKATHNIRTNHDFDRPS
jgi:hypothetical protein